MSLKLTLEFPLSCQHHLENPEWSASKNTDYFGICFRRHGHFYGIQLVLEVDFAKAKGIAVDRAEIEEIFNRYVKSKLDNRFLNEIYANTSGESLSASILDLLKDKMPSPVRLVAVQIQETRKNWFACEV